MLGMAIANAVLGITLAALVWMMLVRTKPRQNDGAKRSTKKYAVNQEDAEKAKIEQKERENFLAYNGDEQPQIDIYSNGK